jgi:hypothetical protein
MGERFAKSVFLVAGIYGVAIVAPEYFLELRYGQDYPPAVTHPEFFYGFVGLCLVFQVLFLVIASNPLRYRPLMLIGVAEKVSFTTPCVVLYLQGKLPGIVLFFSLTDLVWAALFLIAYRLTPAAMASRNK